MAVWRNVSLSASYVLNDRAVCCKLLFPSALWLGVYGVAWYIRGCKAHVAKNNPLVLLDIDDSDAVSRVLVVGCNSRCTGDSVHSLSFGRRDFGWSKGSCQGSPLALVAHPRLGSPD